MTYSQAISRLEAIVSSLENEKPELETLGEHLKEAQQLLKFCQETLLKVETDVNDILNPNEQK